HDNRGNVFRGNASGRELRHNIVVVANYDRHSTRGALTLALPLWVRTSIEQDLAQRMVDKKEEIRPVNEATAVLVERVVDANAGAIATTVEGIDSLGARPGSLLCRRSHCTALLLSRCIRALFRHDSVPRLELAER